MDWPCARDGRRFQWWGTLSSVAHAVEMSRIPGGGSIFAFEEVSHLTGEDIPAILERKIAVQVFGDFIKFLPQWVTLVQAVFQSVCHG